MQAILALEDGSLFHGQSIGASGQTVGEVVFNTAMTGYQEILTDPSYTGQIVTFTYPHIGNVGMNAEDEESHKPWAAGLIVRDVSLLASNWRSQQSLPDYLLQQGIVGISDIDTRRLTRLLREKGALRGCITTEVQQPEKAIQAARDFPSMNGCDLAQVVSTEKQYFFQETVWRLGVSYQMRNADELPYDVVAYDFGVKRNILRCLVERGCRVLVVPAKTPAEDVLALNPHGIFLSNGPGDPAACSYAIEAIRVFLAQKIPLFGICLGHQLLGLASGGKTIKMKFGHHGSNHPVKELKTERVFITSQNHGFAIDDNALPDCLQITHQSLFDQSIQGIQHRDAPAFGFQGHPEASPGPHDITPLFDEFITLMKNDPHKETKRKPCQPAETSKAY